MKTNRYTVWYAHGHCPQCRVDLEAAGQAGSKPVGIECPECKGYVAAINRTVYPLTGFKRAIPLYLETE